MATRLLVQRSGRQIHTLETQVRSPAAALFLRARVLLLLAHFDQAGAGIELVSAEQENPKYMKM